MCTAAAAADAPTGQRARGCPIPPMPTRADKSEGTGKPLQPRGCSRGRSRSRITPNASERSRGAGLAPSRRLEAGAVDAGMVYGLADLRLSHRIARPRCVTIQDTMAAARHERLTNPDPPRRPPFSLLLFFREDLAPGGELRTDCRRARRPSSAAGARRLRRAGMWPAPRRPEHAVFGVRRGTSVSYRPLGAERRVDAEPSVRRTA